jgi:hypothetical protein
MTTMPRRRGEKKLFSTFFSFPKKFDCSFFGCCKIAKKAFTRQYCTENFWDSLSSSFLQFPHIKFEGFQRFVKPPKEGKILRQKYSESFES